MAHNPIMNDLALRQSQARDEFQNFTFSKKIIYYARDFIDTLLIGALFMTRASVHLGKSWIKYFSALARECWIINLLAKFVNRFEN